MTQGDEDASPPQAGRGQRAERHAHLLAEELRPHKLGRLLRRAVLPLRRTPPRTQGTSVFKAGSEGVLFFCIHGAGHSALSFATLAREVKHFATIVAFDLKGHGFSKKEHEGDDYSIETLCSESVEALKELLQRFPDKNVVVVGHSLGGSIACRIVDSLTNVEKLERIVGCIVIDVVEGTAIEALPFMNQIITDRPKHFDTLQSAIKWWYSSPYSATPPARSANSSPPASPCRRSWCSTRRTGRSGGAGA